MTSTTRIGTRAVHRVGYGAMQLVPEQRLHPGRSVPRATAIEVLRRAVDLGVQLIDTAEFYGAGAVNPLLREALAPYPDGLVLATKVGAVHAGDGLVAAQRPAELRAQVEQNLRSLGVERLGVVNLRRVDAPPGIVAEGEQVVDLDDQLAELAAMREEGLIEAIGLSAVTLEQTRRALPVGVACVQNRYNLLEREADDLLDACRAEGIAFVPFFPLGSGIAGRPTPTRQPDVLAVAAELEATPQQVCLAWLLAQAPEVVLIPGTSSVGHLESNVAAGNLGLTAGQLQRLGAV